MYGGYPQKNRIQQKSKQRISARLYLYIHVSFWVLLATSVFFAVIWSPFFYIKGITVEGNQVIDEEHIRDVVETVLVAKTFLVIPNGNGLTVAKAAIEKGLISAYPRIKEAEVDISGLHTIHVVVSERDPHYTYCDSAEVCSLLDSSGFAFESATDFRSTPISIRGERSAFLDMNSTEVASDTPVIIPQQILSTEVFEKINVLSDGFARLGFITSQIVLQKAGYTDFYVSYNALGYIKLSVHIEDTAEKILANLETAKQNSALGTALSNDPAAIDYIILYTGNKVIFKEKGVGSGTGK